MSTSKFSYFVVFQNLQDALLFCLYREHFLAENVGQVGVSYSIIPLPYGCELERISFIELLKSILLNSNSNVGILVGILL